MGDEMTSYADRDAVLVAMGYPDYENYRSRALWRRIRERVLTRDDETCHRCRGRAAVVHHRCYTAAVLKGEDDAQLVSLCDGCHEVVEFDDVGARRSAADKEAVLATPCWRRDYPAIKVDLRHKLLPHPADWARMNWWQRRGWATEYQYVRLCRKSPQRQALWEPFRATFEAVKASTPETDWREVAALLPKSKDKA